MQLETCTFLDVPALICPPDVSDRLDRVVSLLIDGVSRTQARRLIASGSVFIDGRRCRVASRVVQPGAQLRVELIAPAEQRAVQSLSILFDDGVCVAVDKPAGMPSVPTRRAARGSAHDTLQRQLRQQSGRATRLWAVHRLDQAASGVLLFAKSAEAAAVISKAFQTRQVQKTYLARVADVPSSEAGVIDQPIRTLERRAEVGPGGRPARTHWRILRVDPAGTLLELRLDTGRMHQARVHLRALGHPILGDRLYGGTAAPRLMLHALGLVLAHPETGQLLELHAPEPPDFITS